LFGAGGIYGGAERYTWELAQHMAAATPTRLVCFGHEAREFTTERGLEVRVLGPAWNVRGQSFNRMHRGLIAALRGAEVIHCHQPHLLSSEAAALFGRLTRRRVFASDLGGGGWGFSSYLRTDGWFHGHLHISEYSRQLAGHTASANAETIFGGVDTELFSPDSAVAREPLAVFVGRMMPHKGVNYLIEALPEGMTLELIGKPYHERFQADLRRLAIGKRVIFREDCNDQAVVNAYRRASCVVLPSVYRSIYGEETKVPELLGQTLLEGMACGTPAIASNVASLPEVVVDGETGFLVPPNDPTALRARLEWFRDHAVDAEQMGALARERVLKRFNWPTVVAKCLTAYAARHGS
jgi:glycosyltransferase involved in cell wall biosynthesis